MTSTPASGVVNAMTIDVEEHFQVSAFDRVIPRAAWESLESRVERNTHRLLDLSGDLPVAVVIVDESARVRRFLHDTSELWQAGLVTVEDVTVVGAPGEDRCG